MVSPTVLHKPYRGAFIVFEGIDRSGKSTQAGLLVDALNKNGVPAELFGFPDRTTYIGQLIDSYLQSETECPKELTNLLFTCNRWEKNNEIKELLHSGITVVCDRYAFSGVTYSVGALGLDLDWCKGPEKGLLSPDIVFFMKTNPNVCSSRALYGAERYDKEQIQRKVQDVYGLFSKYRNWLDIDASDSIEAIHEEVHDLTYGILYGVQQGGEPLLTLWNGENDFEKDVERDVDHRQ